MASFTPFAVPQLKVQLGADTDIGGGRENQDAFFVWAKKELGLIVLGVLDGHGREVGKIASEAAKKCIMSMLDAQFTALIQNPVEFLIRAHELAHDYIRDAFQKELESMGFQIEQTNEHYLLKRKSANDPWTCVHGGTSCTLVAIVNSSMYIANVGDSTAVLCTGYPTLQRQFLRHEVDASFKEPGSMHSSSSNNTETVGSTFSGLTDHSSMSLSNSTNGPAIAKVLVLSADHSPESPYEFSRLRRYRCRENDPQLPALTVVYDSPTHDKSQCYAIFPNPSLSEPLIPSNRGSYYKNVRREWASLVATPKTARFQDALAFTRSLGDLHLHTYGKSSSRSYAYI
jgi:serine/threonine protein phosphatase PrpC